jgi:F-type H+-transporting ATPase subunit b
MKMPFVILLALTTSESNLFAAEAGMPQLDPKYWASQAFWLILVFTILYVSIAKFFLPKIKNNLDDRENKIKDDLDDAKNFKETAEKKQKEYSLIIEEGKKEVLKIILDSRNKLQKDMQIKKQIVEKEIDEEINKVQKEIVELKKNSINNIINISEEITSKIIYEISGEKLNESSIEAAVLEISKKNSGKYL